MQLNPGQIEIILTLSPTYYSPSHETNNFRKSVLVFLKYSSFPLMKVSSWGVPLYNSSFIQRKQSYWKRLLACTFHSVRIVSSCINIMDHGSYDIVIASIFTSGQITLIASIIQTVVNSASGNGLFCGSPPIIFITNIYTVVTNTTYHFTSKIQREVLVCPRLI